MLKDCEILSSSSMIFRGSCKPQRLPKRDHEFISETKQREDKIDTRALRQASPEKLEKVSQLLLK